MAAKFRKVDPRMWTDEKFRRLKPDEKVLAVWMLTSSRVNRCGIVLWSPGLASEETGIPLSRIDTVCHTVCHTLRWVRDTVSETVFLTRWWRYNHPDNIKALVGALSDLHDIPSHGLHLSLREAVKDLRDEFHTVYLSALDTVCHTVSDTVCAQEQEQEQEKEQEQEQKTIHCANGVSTSRKRTPKHLLPYSSDFERFWQAYPSVRKKSKGEAWKAWIVAITIADPELLIEAAEEYARSPKGTGEFSQMPSTWLNQRCWDDDREAWGSSMASRCPTPEDLARWNPVDGGLGHG